MIISCMGHSMFLIELESGLRIVTDPVDAGSGYPVQPVRADVVLMSHHHHDHCCMDAVAGTPAVCDRACGRTQIAPDVFLTGIRAWHDDAQGTKRGENVLFLIEAEGLRVAHLGDLGHLPDAAQTAALSPVDLLMVPVGGFYTIDAMQARETAARLQTHTILPMHYKTAGNADWPIAGYEAFGTLFRSDVQDERPLLRVTSGDLGCLPKVVRLIPTLGK